MIFRVLCNEENTRIQAVGGASSVAMVTLLIENSANPNDVSHAGGLTPLMLAVINNDKEMVGNLPSRATKLQGV